jgi:prevent-host-death family protein
MPAVSTSCSDQNGQNMMVARADNTYPKTGRGQPDKSGGALPSWKLEEAKARFSEVVRLARERGPQRVTVHGRDAVVVLSAADYARLAPAAAGTSLAALFSAGPFARLENFEDSLVRERAPVRAAPDFDT